MTHNLSNRIHAHLALAFLVGALTLLGPAFPASHSTVIQAQGRTGLVLAFYYAWYNEGSFGPGKTAFQPPEPYNSSDPAVIQRHVNQAKAAGIDGFVQSWYGPGEGVTNGNLQTLLDVASASGFKAAVDFEPATFLSNNDERGNALRSLLETHATHPAYLRVDGKPVIFFWANWAYSVEDWAYIRSIADPNHNSIWIAEGARTEYLQVFDGLHLYSIAWSANPNGIASTWAANTRAAADTYGAFKYWVATAMPGFDDRHLGRGDATVYRDRAGGAYYQNSFASAAASNPDMLIITSFNEWAEGSNIEPSTTFGNTYLDLTAQLVSGYKSGGVAPPPPLPQATATEQTPETDSTRESGADEELVAAGQPATGTPEATAASSLLPTPLPDGRILYEVVEGDTLSAIAFRFGISLQELYSLNDLDEDSLLSVGQSIIIATDEQTPDGAPTPLPAGVNVGEDGNLTYEVEAGDTLIGIAVQHDLTMEELLALNPTLTEQSLLQLGQQIVVDQQRQPESVGGSTDFPEGAATPTAETQVASPSVTAVASLSPTNTAMSATATQVLAVNEPATRPPEPSNEPLQEPVAMETAPIDDQSTPTWLIVVGVFIAITAVSGGALLILGRQKPDGDKLASSD